LHVRVYTDGRLASLWNSEVHFDSKKGPGNLVMIHMGHIISQFIEQPNERQKYSLECKGICPWIAPK